MRIEVEMDVGASEMDEQIVRLLEINIIKYKNKNKYI